MLPVVILAGGLATRLRPVTEIIPKALVEVAGRPFIDRQLDYLRVKGVEEVVLCVGHMGKQIQKHLRDGKKFGLKICYSFDGPQLLGTGGAIKKALNLLRDHFFILYGDSFLSIDFSAVEKTYQLNNQLALMAVLKNHNQWDKSNVLFVNGKLIEYNKKTPKSEMTYIDYGFGLVSAKIFDAYPQNVFFDLADVYEHLASQKQLLGYEVHERFYEIGTHQGLKEAEEYFLTKGNA